MLSRTCSTLAAAVALSVIAGCYEEVSPQQPTAQTPPQALNTFDSAWQVSLVRFSEVW